MKKLANSAIQQLEEIISDTPRVENKQTVHTPKTNMTYMEIAAKHHLKAAQYHLKAAKYHKEGNDEKASKNSLLAQAHLNLASEALKADEKRFDCEIA